MADATPQKRVLPARDRRDSAAKRMASSPTPLPTPSLKKTPAQATEPRQKRKYTKRASLAQPSTPSARSTPSVAEEILPVKLTSSKPLPTTRQKQATHLSPRDYQTIADSAILAASLHRSRVQWLCEGIFPKYWTKPIKKKGITDVPPNNPDQKSMQKLGNATITIEPHTFDVVFFTVRDPQAPLPYYRHPNQHTPKTAAPPAPGYGAYYPPGPTTPTPAPYSPAGALFPQPPSQPPVSAIKQETVLSAGPSVAPPASIPVSLPARQEPKPPAPATPQAAPGSAQKANTDPVIQMLAARAASDPRLKELMKVVATSKASPEQLKEFQSHIDEFNAVVRRQEAEKAGREKEPQRSSTAAPPALPQVDGGNEAKPAPKPTAPAPSTTPGATHPVMFNSPAARAPAPGLLPPPGPVGVGPSPPYVAFPPQPRPETMIKHIVVEFTGNASGSQAASPDRWLWPEFAVLDIRYGGLEMTASFFVERKGSDIIAAMGATTPEEMAALQSKWKADQDYYQPVTLGVKANHHRTIESIARAAKSLPAVQEHMKDVMKNKTRVPEDYLVHQLPREKGLASAEVPSVDFVDSAVELGSGGEDDVLRDYYGN